MELFRVLVAQDDVVLGVGFKVARDALELSKLSRQVYAFEPNPFALARMKRSVRRRTNIQLFGTGAGEKDRISRLRVPELYGKPQGARSVSIQLGRLDKVQFSLPPTCLVLNCGGAEMEALKGAEGLLSSRKVRTVLLKSHLLLDGRETSREATLWLLEHGFGTEPKRAEDGSLWIIGKTHRKVS